jgi:glycosyltransferase involved in cell wall biosynthesis
MHEFPAYSPMTARIGNHGRPFVTIGMPVYNGADTLEQALQSVERQTYGNWQLVVSDDGSTDDSLKIIRYHADRDRRIVLHQQQRNLGHLGNFHFVLKECRSPYFMWHCQDDWTDVNYIATLLVILEAHQELDLACGASERVAADGSLIKRKPFPHLRNEDQLRRVQKLLVLSDATRIFGLFRVTALAQVFRSALDLGYVWAWDPAALLPLILEGKIGGTNDTTFYWRDTGLSAQRYRPAGLATQLVFLAKWHRLHLARLAESNLPVSAKIRCVSHLFVHANERSGVSLYRTYIRSPYRTYVKAPIKMLLSGANR